MNRLGLLDPASLNEEQKDLYDVFTDYTQSEYGTKFTTKVSNSRLAGLFGIHLHHPLTGQIFLQFAKSLATIPDLPVPAREVAILVVSARTQSAYENYAHAALSGFTERQLKQIEEGVCPEEFDEKMRVAFKVATELGRPGVLKREVWEEGVRVLGVDGMKALVHYVAFYSYIATILNGFGAEVPE